MKYVRFSSGSAVRYGVVEADTVVEIEGDIFSTFKMSRRTHRLGQVRLLAPCVPSKIVGLGLNYQDHADEAQVRRPDEPLIFLKAPTSVIGPDDPIILPPSSTRVDHEGELAVVIGRKAKDVTPSEAMGYVLGFTCANDVSARDLQHKDGQWTRAKSFDTFAPLGPWIVTDAVPDNLKLEVFLNGERRQSASTADMIFKVPEVISFVSRVMTLLPGDVILTGTCAGVGPMKPGDEVEVRIEKVGSLRNRCERTA